MPSSPCSELSIMPTPAIAANAAVIQTADVFVRDDGLTITTDYNGGLDILEYVGN